jgi:hypothetical protein
MCQRLAARPTFRRPPAFHCRIEDATLVDSRPRGQDTLIIGRFIYLIANGFVGDPTAPVIGMAGATNMNS